ncbi:hypothetical protein EG68_01177 [Paragonimus skrjabini miyazakii]|uniref:Uncharacterized protein n=1 Tax=Paragonimus skrjabini miyazakii TaxID=59628 RepID=A0A8S9Z399_9TREM|nr:hypothetical protein EG68_01177 [Paragonimus skrjabini miyazakii]
MEPREAAKKSILKKQNERFQRSSSMCMSTNQENYFDNLGDAEISKKRAVIRDENGVWLPGEQDEDSPSDSGQQVQPSSVADRTAGERVSYRLIQQRSLDYGLYNQLHRCALEPNSDMSIVSPDEPIDVIDDQPKPLPTIGNQMNPRCDLGRLITSQSPSENTVIQLLQQKPSGPSFSLRDVLAHRLPGFSDDIDDELESAGLEKPKNEVPMDMQQTVTQPQTSP